MSKYPESWDNQKHPELLRYRAPIVHGRAATGLLRGLLTDRPCAVVSLGDAEVKFWAITELSELPGVGTEWLHQSSKASGLCPDGDARLWPAFNDALCASPILLVQYHWPAVERLSLHALEIHDMFGTKPAVSCNEVYRMQRNGDFFPVLDGRRVLLVGGGPGWPERMADAGFQERHGASYEVVGHVAVPPRNQRPKAPYLPGILAEVDGHKFDIALVAAGGLAVIICGHIASRRRFAFDCGAVDRMVMGDTRRGPGFDVPKGDPPRNGTPIE